VAIKIWKLLAEVIGENTCIQNINEESFSLIYGLKRSLKTGELYKNYELFNGSCKRNQAAFLFLE